MIRIQHLLILLMLQGSLLLEASTSKPAANSTLFGFSVPTIAATIATTGGLYFGYKYYQSQSKEQEAEDADDQAMKLVSPIIKASNSLDPKVDQKVNQDTKQALLKMYAKLPKKDFSICSFEKAIDEYNKLADNYTSINPRTGESNRWIFVKSDGGYDVHSRTREYPRCADNPYCIRELEKNGEGHHRFWHCINEISGKRHGREGSSRYAAQVQKTRNYNFAATGSLLSGVTLLNPTVGLVGWGLDALYYGRKYWKSNAKEASQQKIADGNQKRIKELAQALLAKRDALKDINEEERDGLVALLNDTEGQELAQDIEAYNRDKKHANLLGIRLTGLTVRQSKYVVKRSSQWAAPMYVSALAAAGVLCYKFAEK